jgi:hypothetical protein
VPLARADIGVCAFTDLAAAPRYQQADAKRILFAYGLQ